MPERKLFLDDLIILAKMYMDDRFTVAQIAEEFGIHRWTVNELRKKMGLPKRSPGRGIQATASAAEIRKARAAILEDMQKDAKDRTIVVKRAQRRMQRHDKKDDKKAAAK